MQSKITPSYPMYLGPDRSPAEKRALIVDDEQSIRYVLSGVLSGFGYACTAASSGKEALEKTSRLKFDLMLLDVNMPGTSGLEVLKEFRAHDDATCVVMLSALIDDEVFVEALRHGADDYLVKPCRPELLQEKLQEAHERRLLALPGEIDPKERESRLRNITQDLIGANDLNEEWPTWSRDLVDSPPTLSAVQGQPHSQELGVCAHCGHRVDPEFSSARSRLEPGLRSRDTCCIVPLRRASAETLVS